MRTLVYVISLLFLSLMLFSERVYSQDVDLVLQELEMPPPAPQEIDNDDPYSLATDAQIEEAQRFYESCKSNRTMSLHKDCKCAAAMFLETRMKLGNAASVNEVMQENVNTCLLDEKKGAVSDVDGLDLEEVTEQQIQEAESIHNWCLGDDDVKRAVDCECLAAKFLDLRIKQGPLVPANSLTLEIIQTSCRNIVETTGMEYLRCMEGTGFNYNTIRPKDYCGCYARMWGKMYESYEGRMDEYKKQSIRLQARTVCSNPEAYKEE